MATQHHTIDISTRADRRPDMRAHVRWGVAVWAGVVGGIAIAAMDTGASELRG